VVKTPGSGAFNWNYFLKILKCYSSLVYERFEISNHELIKSMLAIVKLEETHELLKSSEVE